MPNRGTALGPFIDTFFRAEALKNQRQQLALMEQNALAERANIATQMATLIGDPERRAALGAIVGDDVDLGAFLEGVAPGPGVLARGTAMGAMEQVPEGAARIAATQEVAGMGPAEILESQFLERIMAGQELSPEDLETLGRVRQFQLATGRSPGELRVAEAPSRLTDEEMDQFARSSLGVSLTAMEREQVAHWAAQHGLNLMQLSQDGALRTAALMAQVWAVEQQIRARMAAGDDRLADMSPNTLMEQIGRSLESIRQPGRATDAELTLNAQVINTALDNLTRMGLFPPTVGRLSTDPDDLRKTMGAAIERRLRDSPQLEPNPVMDLIGVLGGEDADLDEVTRLLRSPLITGMGTAPRSGDILDLQVRGPQGLGQAQELIELFRAMGLLPREENEQ